MTLPPPLTALSDLDAQLAGSGYAVLDAESLARCVGVRSHELAAWAPLWHDLPPDQHLKDGGRYRRRRHGCFVLQPGAPGHEPGQGQGVMQAVPHRAHWQPVEYNALHGGIERWFDPLPAAMAEAPAWSRLLGGLAQQAARLRGGADQPWYVEAHPFRIDTTDGIGRPTPEGAHRDGVELVVVILVARQGIKGGETRVFDARGPQGVRFTLAEPWSALLLDDTRVIHESTPIQPIDAAAGGYRDTLVLTFRRGGFQGPAL
ncbi:2OG-Fe dioxygenase family protein [Aquabacterium sp. OR-4]|uniref:2OG-Fe dioxygenase family protein n=1 Tax=Aquabacterium sp. OR-4 TaxID=2978127 RepID=UPI0021B257DE|nr:2OG-Fe dioxygenase family protein [Aquabacterium sp. OR-4]MDT7835678.1 2OG-Fe dioxygenase family protein [Aquabacterium sp. OR-4]